MTKVLLSALVSILLFAGCTRPKLCTTALDGLPPLRGFKLGMSADEIRQKFPQIQPRPSLDHPEFESVFLIRTNPSERLPEEKALLVSATEYPELEGVNEVRLNTIGNEVSKV